MKNAINEEVTFTCNYCPFCLAERKGCYILHHSNDVIITSYDYICSFSVEQRFKNKNHLEKSRIAQICPKIENTINTNVGIQQLNNILICPFCDLQCDLINQSSLFVTTLISGCIYGLKCGLQFCVQKSEMFNKYPMANHYYSIIPSDALHKDVNVAENKTVFSIYVNPSL